jgi:hypothetical protein
LTALATHLFRRHVEELRHLGHAGETIPRHRALLTSRPTARKLVPSLLLAVSAVAAWLLVLLPWTTSLWFRLLSYWQQALGLGDHVAMVGYRVAGLYEFETPWVVFSSALPGGTQLLSGAIAVAVVLLASFLVPRRLAPLVYSLRVLALTQATAEVFFTYWPEAFPYDGASYVHGMLLTSLALLTIVPPMLALVYYVFDFTILRKAWLTLLVLAHLALFCPLQYLAHAVVLHRGSLLTMPLLFLAFGLPLDVMIFVAFYGWGMSWKSELRELR